VRVVKLMQCRASGWRGGLVAEAMTETTLDENTRGRREVSQVARKRVCRCGRPPSTTPTFLANVTAPRPDRASDWFYAAWKPYDAAPRV
jgi:hypothetical protein